MSPAASARQPRPAPLSLAQPPAKSTASPQPTAEDPLKQARLLVATERCQEAIQRLEEHLQVSPKEAPAHYLLGAALICRKQYEEGLAAYARAIALNKDYARDPRVLKDAQRLLALDKQPELRTATIKLLAEQVGKPALPLLLELASNHKSYELRHQAIEAVDALDAADEIDWVTSLGLDLRQIRKCADRKKVVAKLRDLGDPRAIPLLKRAQNARTGFFRQHSRNGCMRKELKEALKELQRKGPDK